MIHESNGITEDMFEDNKFISFAFTNEHKQLIRADIVRSQLTSKYEVYFSVTPDRVTFLEDGTPDPSASVEFTRLEKVWVRLMNRVVSAWNKEIPDVE